MKLRMKKIAPPVIPTVEISVELLDLLRGELRRSQAETRRLKAELNRTSQLLKKNKDKQAELSRLMNRFEKALQWRKGEKNE